MTTTEKISELLEMKKQSELVDIYNQYCDAINDPDSRIEEGGRTFIENYFSSDLMAAVYQMDCNSNFKMRHDYARFDGCGNIESTDDPENDWIDIEEIADYCVKNDEDFGESEIRSILDGDETEDDETEDDFLSVDFLDMVKKHLEPYQTS